jgi:hypothetical protein
MDKVKNPAILGLPIVCYAQDNRVCGVCPSSVILNEHNVSENGSVSVLKWQRGEVPLPLDLFH